MSWNGTEPAAEALPLLLARSSDWLRRTQEAAGPHTCVVRKPRLGNMDRRCVRCRLDRALADLEEASRLATRDADLAEAARQTRPPDR